MSEGNSFERLQSGAVITYRGRNTRIKIARSACKETKIEYRNGFHITVPNNLSGKQIEDTLSVELNFWLRDRLKEDALQLVKEYCRKLDLKSSYISIMKNPSLWGSCTKRGVIKLNWHLITAPKSVLAYVVLHEVCHLRFRNHSKHFWDLLASQMPGYEVNKKWLEMMNPTYAL